MSSESEDFEYSDEDDNLMDDNDAASNPNQALEINIENTFYKAQQSQRADPDAAIKLFKDAIGMVDTHPDPSSNIKSFKSKAQTAILIVLIAGMLESPAADPMTFAKIKVELNEILSQQTDPNEKKMVVRSVFDLLKTKVWKFDKDTRLLFAEIYDLCVEKTKRGDGLWFKGKIMLAKIFLENKNVDKLKQALQSLLEVHESGSVQVGADLYLFELLAVELGYYELKGMAFAMQNAYDRVVEFASKSAIQDPSVMGYIYETGAKLDMAKQQWSSAYDKFSESFRAYQESGKDRSKQVLKFVLLANMLGVISINPFDSREAKALEEDAEIKPMVQLRKAFDDRDVIAFECLLRNKAISEDDYIVDFARQLLKNMQKKVLEEVLAPFNRVRLSYLSEKLGGIPIDDVEQLLRELLFEKHLPFKIDILSMTLIKQTPEAADDKTCEALNGILGEMEGVLSLGKSRLAAVGSSDLNHPQRAGRKRTKAR